MKRRAKADPYRSVVKSKLETLGYISKEIPEGTELSADLSATGPDRGLVVEVKSRRDDLEEGRRFHTGPAGRIIKTHSPIVHDNALSRLVHTAAKQIASSQRHYSGLGMLWFRADPELGISHADEKMITTLLGRRHALVRGKNGIVNTTVCYLAGYTDFYHHRGIDLAVVEDSSGGATLLINPYSKHLDDVRRSRLVTTVAASKPRAIIDLHRLKTPENGYVVWGDFSRAREATVLAELKKRFPDLDFDFFDMKSHIGRVRMDR
jgi:hypothetical protein